MTEASADMVMARYCRNRAAGQTEAQSKKKRRGLEKSSHSIEDPLPFKNFDEGALHLKRFASRCTNGAGGRSLEIEVLSARRRWGRGVLLPGQALSRALFFFCPTRRSTGTSRVCWFGCTD